MEPTKKKILFVCLGNIIRSPLAENMFMYLVKQRGAAGRYEADSAGTGDWHVGEPPDARMRKTAADHGFQYDGRARQVHGRDLDDFDLIVAMDEDNLLALQQLSRTGAHQRKLRLLRAYDPQARPTDPVPDPYYGGQAGFERVFNIVERSCRGLLDALEAGDF